MKTTKFLQAASLVLILVIAISCRSSRSTTSRQYPRNPTPPTQTATKTNPVYVDGGNIPPGQAKKIYGGQSAKAYAPGQRKKYPLVIIQTSAIVITRHSDGRYYYRNSAGYTYWKGDDGRYYIDEKHLKDMEYEEVEYDDWKVKGQKNDKAAQEPKGKAQEEKVKQAEKTKDEQVAKVKEEKGQSQKAKDTDQKEKDQTDQKVKDNGQKEEDQKGQKAKGNDEKGKDQTDKTAKDDKAEKGKAKSKDKG